MSISPVASRSMRKYICRLKFAFLTTVDSCLTITRTHSTQARWNNRNASCYFLKLTLHFNVVGLTYFGCLTLAWHQSWVLLVSLLLTQFLAVFFLYKFSPKFCSYHILAKKNSVILCTVLDEVSLIFSV